MRKSYATRRRHYKIIKSSVSELGLAADRFSIRAEAIENRSSNLNAFAAIAAEYGNHAEPFCLSHHRAHH